jgi:16S rRNA (guanine966-N2)-methyltransferase
VRVIAGVAKGRRLKSPIAGTRPMADRMKESLFSSLGEFDGLRILDLYAGSGSLGLEALSRGAERSLFVENAQDAIQKLRQNVDATGLEDRSEVLWADVSSTLARPAEDRVDLIFLDPPYSMPTATVRQDLEAIVMGGWLADDGRVVLHRPVKDSRFDPFGLKIVWQREYGQSQIYVFAHEEEET